MATPTPTQPQNSPSASSSFSTVSTNMSDDDRRALIHNVSLAALIICPLVMVLPPRKFDKYTVLLMTSTFLGGNQLAYEYTGRSIVGRFKEKVHAIQSLGSGDSMLPEKAKVIQIRLREEKERRERRQGHYANTLEKEAKNVEGKTGGVLDEVERLKKEKESGGNEQEKEGGIVERVRLSSEGEDWKAKRDKREREALEEGRGYSGLIMDQIWEVWNWGKVRAEEIKEKDEEIIQERKNNSQAQSATK